MWPYLYSGMEHDNSAHLNDTSMFRHKSHPAQLNWRGAVSISEVLSSRQVLHVCICLDGVCVGVCKRRDLISVSFRWSDACVGLKPTAERVNLRHLLCTSSIFLDSWHFTSWTNCQLSKLNFRNDMSKFHYPLHVLPSCYPSPPPLLHSLRLLCIYFYAILTPQTCQERTIEVQNPAPFAHAVLPVLPQ